MVSSNPTHETGATVASTDVAIVGAGAAGLAIAIFAARRRPDLNICVLDGAKKVGAKILVSGGGRCNVTNQVVTSDHYFGGSRHFIRRVLDAFPVSETIAFFREIGVPMHVEEYGKVFPDSNIARTVLAALLDEAGKRRVRILSAHRVISIAKAGAGFQLTIQTPSPAISPESGGGVQEKTTTLRARLVVLATGGRSLPKTGSDGGGYALATALGHALVTQTPALAPLVLEGAFHGSLSGIAQEVEIMARIEGDKPVRLRGPMLWTHFGISGPAAMDISRVWHRAKLDGAAIDVYANFLPGETFESAEPRLLDFAARQPRAHLANALTAWVPARVGDAMLAALQMEGQTPLAHVTRETRRRLIHALMEWPLPVRDSRGYAYAEATAGGIPLDEIDPATMASRKCPGLLLVGEILDVDGRIGGYNFQWAWSSGFVAAMGIARSLA